MNSELTIVIKALSNTKEIVEESRKDIAKVSAGIKEVGESSKEGTKSILEFFKSFKENSAETSKSLKNIAESAGALSTKLASVGTAIKFVTSGILAVGAGSMVKNWADAAARAQVLETTMLQVGKTAGYTSSELEKTDKKVQALGITTASSRQSIVQLIQSGIDLSLAGPLARASQDLAVVSGLNSSETFSRLIVNIQQMDTMGLRFMGIMVDREKVLADAATKQGRALTQNQEKQAFAEGVLKESAKLAGVYASAMNDVGKAITSLPRFKETLEEKLGATLLPAYAVLVRNVTELFKDLIASVDASNKSGDGAFSWTKDLDAALTSLRKVVVVMFEYRAAIATIGIAAAGLLIFGKVLAILAGIGPSLAAISTQLAPLGLFLAGLFTPLAGLATAAIVGIIAAFGSLTGAILVVLGTITAIVAGVDLTEFLRKQYPGFDRFATDVENLFKKLWSFIAQDAEQEFTRLVNLLETKLLNPIKSIVAGLLDTAATAVDKIPLVGGTDKGDSLRAKATSLRDEVDSQKTQVEALAEVNKSWDEYRANLGQAKTILGEVTSAALDSVKASKIPEDSKTLILNYIEASKKQKEAIEQVSDAQQKQILSQKAFRESVSSGAKDQIDAAQEVSNQADKKLAEAEKKQKKADDVLSTVQNSIRDRKKSGSLDAESLTLLENFERALVRSNIEFNKVQESAQQLSDAFKVLGLTSGEMTTGTSEKIRTSAEALKIVIDDIANKGLASDIQIRQLISQYNNLAAGAKTSADLLKLSGLREAINDITVAASAGKSGPTVDVKPPTIDDKALKSYQSALESASKQAKENVAKANATLLAGGAKALSDGKSIAKAKLDAEEAQIARQLKIVKEGYSRYTEGLSEFYDQALVTTKEFYDTRRKLIDQENAVEFDSLSKQIVLEKRKLSQTEKTGRAPILKKIDELTSQRDVELVLKKQYDLRKLDNEERKKQEDFGKKLSENAIAILGYRDEEKAKLAEIELKYSNLLRYASEGEKAQLKELERLETLKALQSIADKEREVRIEILGYSDALAASQDKINLKYDQQLRNVSEDRKVQLEKLRVLELQNDLLEQQKRKIDARLALENAGLSIQQALIGLKSSRGELSDLDKQNQENAIILKRIELLKESYEAKKKASEDIRNNGSIEAAAKEEAALRSLGAEILTLSAQYKTLSTTIQESFATSTFNLFKSFSDQTLSFWGKIKKSANEFASSLTDIVFKEASQKIAISVSKIGKGEDGKGVGPFDFLASLISPDKKAVLGTKTNKMWVDFDRVGNTPDSPKDTQIPQAPSDPQDPFGIKGYDFASIAGDAAQESGSKVDDVFDKVKAGVRSSGADILNLFKLSSSGIGSILNSFGTSISSILSKIFTSSGNGGASGLGSLFSGGFSSLGFNLDSQITDILSATVGFAEGGLLSGPGTGTSDSIIARVSDGEYIVPAEATKRYLPLLEAMRGGFNLPPLLQSIAISSFGLPQGMVLPRFASGGVVNVPRQDGYSMSRGRQVVNHFNITTPNPVSFKESEGQLMAKARKATLSGDRNS